MLRQRDFALLFSGQVVSTIGDQVTPIALSFAVLDLHGSAGDLGIVLGAQALALALFVLLGGVWADRVPRHRLMVASDAVRGGVQAVMAVLLLTNGAAVWSLAALAFIYGTAEAFFRPASIALVPQVVGPDALQQANALVAFMFSFGAFVGPVIAGVLISLIGSPGTILLDSATFVVSAATLLALRPRPAELAPRSSALREIRAGWREARRHAWMLAGFATFAVYFIGPLSALFVLGPALAKAELGGASAWATIIAGWGAGAIIGSVVLLRFRPRRPMVAVFGFCCIASLQPAIVALPLPVLALALLLAVAGICTSIFWTLWDTTLQRSIPEQAMSRVSAFDHLASLAGFPIGMAVAGPIGDAIGLRETMLAASALGLTASLMALTVPAVRRFRADVPRRE